MTNGRRQSDPGAFLRTCPVTSLSRLGPWTTVTVAAMGVDSRFIGFSRWAVAGCGAQRPAAGFGVTALPLGIGVLDIIRPPTKKPE